MNDIKLLTKQFRYAIDVARDAGDDDDFHRLFKVKKGDINENKGLDSLGNACQPRLKELYDKIIKYIQ